MSDPVKRRSYAVAGRQRQSAATRQRIIDAGRELVLASGYRATTVAAVAALAGVNVDTVYRLVGRKPVLMRELIEQALSGTDHAVTADERAHVMAMRAEPDPVVRLTLYAQAMRETHARLAPLFLALRDASSTEPDARNLWQQISDRRATNMRTLAGELPLRDGLSVEDAADTVWVLNSPELFVLLTDERGWPPERYERWLADGLCRMLLPPLR
ncbi:MAG: TetR/AcrR family transcriptional regulator [Streptosporangiaceae bacterium]